MTMHLVGPYLTTTNYKKRKNIKFKSAEHKAKYMAEQEAWAKLLKKHNVDPANLAKRKAKIEPWVPQPKVQTREITKVSSSKVDHGIVPGTCAKPAPKVYTGDKLIGIATMHKSNMVPVFKMEDAQDIARMRR
jgi:hypothetical protein